MGWLAVRGAGELTAAVVVIEEPGVVVIDTVDVVGAALVVTIDTVVETDVVVVWVVAGVVTSDSGVASVGVATVVCIGAVWMEATAVVVANWVVRACGDVCVGDGCCGCG